MSHYLLTEAILACRGKNLDNSDLNKDYNLNKLCQWLEKNI
jgi:hypothetical protein